MSGNYFYPGRERNFYGELDSRYYRRQDGKSGIEPKMVWFDEASCVEEKQSKILLLLEDI